MDEIQQQIDEIIARMDEGDTALQDLSDGFDSAISDVGSALEDTQATISQLTDDSGQLLFPLNQNTIDLIKEQFPSGFVTLVGGAKTLLDPRISPTSNIFMSVATPGGTQGHLSYAATAGQAVFTSTSGTETSVLSYLILS